MVCLTPGGGQCMQQFIYHQITRAIIACRTSLQHSYAFAVDCVASLSLAIHFTSAGGGTQIAENVTCR